MPGLFDPWSLGSLQMENRIVISPMCQYMATESGRCTDWHLVHYGSMALGGAGLMMVEASAVEARGRISERDIGLYLEENMQALKRIVQFVHEQGIKIGIQLAHAGRKADISAPIVAPSAIAFSDHYQTPHAMAAEELEEVATAFATAATRVIEAGFDVVEVHAAHGYLLHQFLSPLSNLRTDEFGGSFENRLRFPVKVVEAVVSAVAGKIPVGIRVSGTEYDAEGYDAEEMTRFCQIFASHGIAFVDVSSGGNLPVAPSAHPGYQLPFAEKIKDALDIPIIAVGMLDDARLAEYAIRSGKTDAVAIGRGFMRDKHWGHSAAIELGIAPKVPQSYRRAFPIQ